MKTSGHRDKADNKPQLACCCRRYEEQPLEMSYCYQCQADVSFIDVAYVRSSDACVRSDCICPDEEGGLREGEGRAAGSCTRDQNRKAQPSNPLRWLFLFRRLIALRGRTRTRALHMRGICYAYAYRLPAGRLGRLLACKERPSR